MSLANPCVCARASGLVLRWSTEVTFAHVQAPLSYGHRTRGEEATVSARAGRGVQERKTTVPYHTVPVERIRFPPTRISTSYPDRHASEWRLCCLFERLAACPRARLRPCKSVRLVAFDFVAELTEHLRAWTRAPSSRTRCTAHRRVGLLWTRSASCGVDYTLVRARAVQNLPQPVPYPQYRGRRGVQAARFAAVCAPSPWPRVAMLRTVCRLLKPFGSRLVRRRPAERSASSPTSLGVASLP